MNYGDQSLPAVVRKYLYDVMDWRTVDVISKSNHRLIIQDNQRIQNPTDVSDFAFQLMGALGEIEACSFKQLDAGRYDDGRRFVKVCAVDYVPEGGVKARTGNGSVKAGESDIEFNNAIVSRIRQRYSDGLAEDVAALLEQASEQRREQDNYNNLLAMVGNDPVRAKLMFDMLKAVEAGEVSGDVIPNVADTVREVVKKGKKPA